LTRAQPDTGRMPPKACRPPELCRRPFRGSAAIRAGLITSAQIRGPAWRRLYRDVYVSADLPQTHATPIAGALLLLPDGAVIAGTSAASAYGVPFGDDDRPVEVRTGAPWGPVNGLKIHTGVFPPCATTTHRSVPVTTVRQTAADLARWLPAIDAVPWIDALLRARGKSRADAHAYAAGLSGPGARAAARTLRLCDPRAESPPESVLRVHLHLAGVKVVAQHWVMRDGEVVARADLALPEIRLAIEYDGQWHADHRQLGRDRARLRELNQAGWYVYYVTKDDLRNPDALVQNIKSVIETLRRSRG
jgi:very-short-patch-repair endonuclease